MEVDGHRADITMMKTSVTLAAFKGRTEVIEEDVKEAAELALPNRMRRKPFDNQSVKQGKLEESIEKHKEKQTENEKNRQEEKDRGHKAEPEVANEHSYEQRPDNSQNQTEGQTAASSEIVFAMGESYQI